MVIGFCHYQCTADEFSRILGISLSNFCQDYFGTLICLVLQVNLVLFHPSLHAFLCTYLVYFIIYFLFHDLKH